MTYMSFLADKTKPILTVNGIIFFLILAIFTAFFTAYSLYTPAFEGQDEPWHYRNSLLWLQGTVIDERYFLHPPLYYLFNVAIFHITEIPPMPDEIKKNFGINLNFEKNRYFHSIEEDFPYSGTSLAVHNLRLASIIFGIITLVFTYKIAQMIFPNDKWLPLFSMASVALIPKFLELNSVINNDGPIWAFVTISIFLLIKYVDTKKSKFLILLGIFIGLSMLVKMNAIVLYPVVFVTLLYLALSNQVTIRSFLKKFGIIVLISIPAGGWHMIQKIIVYAPYVDVQQSKDIFKLFASPSYYFTTQPVEFELSTGMQHFVFENVKLRVIDNIWSRLSFGTIQVPDYWIFVAEFFMAIAILGLFLILVRKIPSFSIKVKIKYWVILLSSAGFMTSGMLTYVFFAGSGNVRYAFPVVAVFGVLFTIGLYVFVDKKRLRLLMLVPLLFLVLLNIQLLSEMEQNYYHGFLDYKNPFETLIEVYEISPNLQQQFPEVRNGEFNALVVWALNDGAKIKENVELRMQEPMFNLLKVYYSNEELQKKFPEVINEHKLEGLTEWALNEGVIGNLILKKSEFYLERYHNNFAG